MRILHIFLFVFLIIFISQNKAEEIEKPEVTPLEKAQIKYHELKAENKMLEKSIEQYVKASNRLENENKKLSQRNTIYGYTIVSTLIISFGLLIILSLKIKELKRSA